MRRLPRSSSFRSRSKGSLLIISIWALTTVSILGIGASHISSSQLRLTQRFEEHAVSQSLAQAALLHVWALRKTDDTPYDTLQELQTEQRRELGRGEFVYTMVDAESRLHLNRSSQEMLARVPGLGLDGAVAITASTLRPFHLKEELRLLEDLTDEMYQQSQEFLTVYGSGAVNINTASAEVLHALGIEDNLVERLMTFRAGDDGQVGTADDGVFEQTGDIVTALQSVTSLLAAQEAVLIQLISQGLLGVHSTAFTLTIHTKLLGRAARTYAIVCDPITGAVKQWTEW
jgi:type II secretory pathway component PulK